MGRFSRYESSWPTGLTLLVCTLATWLGHTTSDAAARVTIHPWEKFLRRIEKQKGSLSETDTKNIEQHFKRSQIERIFSSEENQEQPILVVRALNLLAGPAGTVSEIFDDHVTDHSAPRGNYSRLSSSKANHDTSYTDSTFTQQATPTPVRSYTKDLTPEEIEKLSASEFVRTALQHAETQGLFAKVGLGWPRFMAAITAPGFDSSSHSFVNATNLLQHKSRYRLDLLKAAADLSQATLNKDLPTLVALLGKLAGITARANRTSPPKMKGNGEKWSLDRYGIQSAEDLASSFLNWSSWRTFVENLYRYPLQGNGRIGRDDYYPLGYALHEVLGRMPDRLPWGDYRRVIYSHIPPVRLLDETLTAAQSIQHRGMPFEQERLIDRLHRAINRQFETTSPFESDMPTTQGTFATQTTKTIEHSILHVDVRGSSPWFHLELISRNLALWARLRDGAHRAAKTSIVDIAQFLASNPVTSVLMNHSSKGKLEEWFPYDEFVINRPLPKVTPYNHENGVWFWSANLPDFIRLDSTSKATQMFPSAVDEAKNRYIFLEPGEYDVSGQVKRLLVKDKRPR